MRSSLMRFAIGLPLLLTLVACGDNTRPCDYDEEDDLANGGTYEATGLTVGTHAKQLCGSIDNAHFDPVFSTIDTDTYRVRLVGDGDLLVQLWGDGGVEVLSRVSVTIFDTAPNPRLVAAGRIDVRLAGHGAFRTQLPLGEYDVVVAAEAGGDLSAPINYRVRLEPGSLTRCPKLTRAADYREAHDGDASTGNDVIDVDYARTPAFTLSAHDDQPEATGLSVEAGFTYRITGTSSDIDHSDAYLDRDTFELATDGTTNELSVRLDWDSTSADLDYIVFEQGTMTQVAASNLTSATEHELATFPVKPDARYWLWIGGFKGGVMPAPFDVAVCGSHFFD